MKSAQKVGKIKSKKWLKIKTNKAFLFAMRVQFCGNPASNTSSTYTREKYTPHGQQSKPKLTEIHT